MYATEIIAFKQKVWIRYLFKIEQVMCGYDTKDKEPVF